MTLRELVLNTSADEMSAAKDAFFTEFMETKDITMVQDTILDIETLTDVQKCIAAALVHYLCKELDLLKYLPEWVEDPKAKLPERYSIYGARGFLKKLRFRDMTVFFEDHNVAFHIE